MSDGGTVRYGIHPLLEAEATAMILASLRGVTSQQEKSDILTPWKEADRRAKEVLSASGSVDPALRRGMYHRASNTRQTHLNGRDGVAAPPRGRAAVLHGDWPTDMRELGS